MTLKPPLEDALKPLEAPLKPPLRRRSGAQPQSGRPGFSEKHFAAGPAGEVDANGGEEVEHTRRQQVTRKRGRLPVPGRTKLKGRTSLAEILAASEEIALILSIMQ